MKMKVLLIQPPHNFDGEEKILPSFFPLGLAYIASSLVQENVEVNIFDIWAEGYSQKEVVEKLNKMSGMSYDLIGISASLSSQYKYVKWLTSEIKKIMDVPIVVGGALVTLSPDIVIRNTDVDICVIGEGDITIKEIIKNLDSLEKVDGIFFKKNGKIIKTKPREYVKNLDEIPFPSWDLFNMDVYFKHIRSRRLPNRVMNVVTSRGCPYRCRFCSRLFTSMRLRSAQNIIDEIRTLKTKFKINGILFSDDLLAVNHVRIKEFCDKIKEMGIKWICQSRVNLVTPDILKNMKEAGCVEISYGVESGSQQILNNMNKGITVEQSIQALNNTVEVGIGTIPNMIFGYVGENKKTLEETIDFFNKVPYTGPISMSVATALPGSELYEYAKKKGFIKDEEKYLEDLSNIANLRKKTTESNSFINFTTFSNEEFDEIKRNTEQAITRIQFKKFKTKVITDYLETSLSYMKEHGITNTFSRASFIIRKIVGSLKGEL